jgi:chitinase
LYAATKAAYNAAGIKLMVSAFGSTETPTSSGFNAVTTAQQMAAWVLQYNVDGIDVDYEVCHRPPRQMKGRH